MNTNSELTSTDWSKVGEVNYEFNRFKDVSKLENIHIKQISCSSQEISNLWDYLSSNTLDQGLGVYVFLHSPYWQQDSRIIRYHALGKFLGEKFSIQHFSGMEAENIVSEGNILFHGIAKVDHVSFASTYRLLCDQENGIFFSASNDNAKLIAEKLPGFIETNWKSGTARLNLVESISEMVHSCSFTLYPYGWSETDDYHLDVFRC